MTKKHPVIKIEIQVNSYFGDHTKVQEAFEGQGLFKAIKHIIRSTGASADDYIISIQKQND